MEETKNSYEKFKKQLLNILIGTLIFNVILLCLVVLLDGKIWFGVFWGVLIAGLYCFFGLLAYLILLIKEPKEQNDDKQKKRKLFGTLVLFLVGIAFSFFNLIVIILINL